MLKFGNKIKIFDLLYITTSVSNSLVTLLFSFLSDFIILMTILLNNIIIGIVLFMTLLCKFAIQDYIE